MAAREQEVEQLPPALVDQQSPIVEPVSSFSARAQEAERAAGAALLRAEQAEAAIVQLQAAKEEAERELMFNAHEAESIAEAAVQRAEVAEGALRHVHHKIAKLQRVLKKWSVQQN